MLARIRAASLLCASLALSLAGTPQAVSQDPTSGGQSDAAAAKADFEAKFTAWKAAMKAIDELRIRYQAADAAEREQIEVQLRDRFEKTQTLVPGVVAAAVKAYRAAPNTDERITNLLVEVAGFYLGSDLYEESLTVIEALQAGGVDNKWIPVWGGVAAVAIADFDAAEQYFKKGEAVLAKRPELPQEQEGWALAKSLASDLESLRAKWTRERQVRTEEAAADDLPRVLLQTNRGEMLVELFENEAPNTVRSFLSLVEKGYYDDRVFHRVLPNFMAQAGGEKTDGSGKGGPGYTVPCECYESNARMHFRGSLSMAHTGRRDTGSAQFFLTFRPTPHLDAKHTVFGRVIDGIDVLGKIQRRDPTKPNQAPADVILSAKVVRKRPDTDYSNFKSTPN